ncbi:ergothioneine biosynthesis glutamate--cysteine ligase EgtA [Actinophytocola sp.]|uniref:ergothioneine biosynthesis glutamate--cysteine ligase EgtA n=1 Tax=Actinophytocola sp. TaxID=1872138 RepID=UPI002D80808B|nr:ergothioneine biosynthesis glutamate--cysteine ligase EgtA [Actinophytocola sp.]HET9143658.1 ergothioneine biosynthesis glutamate--cysteine ligase EgtA [Actinophytocola sp.]
MTALRAANIAEPQRRRLRDRVEAEAYVASVCFKHGPPRLTGIELEWTVHHRDDPRRPLDADHLRAALGPYAPRTLVPDSPQLPLPAGSPLTLEPGGQVEISALPQTSLADLFDNVSTDLGVLVELLAAEGLVLGQSGTDPHRSPRRILDTPRYAAMERAFTPIGPHGMTMMCCTAALQVCLDAGEADTLARRWAAVCSLGPVLVAAFANSPDLAGRATGWASNRLRSVLAVDPARSAPSAISDDPVRDWARRVLDTPLLCVRGPGECWDAPAGTTFADWLDGALGHLPTVDDLDYHVTTMFTPVRPHGYFEVRYLDTQSGADWMAPVALLSALMSSQATVDTVVELCRPVADRWLAAARAGLADQKIAQVAGPVLELGIQALPETGLGKEVVESITADLDRVLRRAARGQASNGGEA